MNQHLNLKLVCRICGKGKGNAFPGIRHDKCAKQLQQLHAKNNKKAEK